MKPNKITPFLFIPLLAFFATKWKGMSYNQRFLIGFVLYGVLGVWLFRAGYFLAWLIGLILLIVIPFIYIIGDLFNLWSKKKN